MNVIEMNRQAVEAETRTALKIKKDLIAKFKTYSICWRKAELEILAMAGLAAREAFRETTHSEPTIGDLAKVAFKSCMSVMAHESHRRRKLKRAA